MKKIEELKTELKKEWNQEKWEQEAKYLTDEARQILEAAVEEVCSVVKRFDYKVHISELPKLAVLDKENCNIAKELFDYFSKNMHDQGLAANMPGPSPKKVEEKIKCLHDWYQNIYEKQKESKS